MISALLPKISTPPLIELGFPPLISFKITEAVVFFVKLVFASTFPPKIEVPAVALLLKITLLFSPTLKSSNLL